MRPKKRERQTDRCKRSERHTERGRQTEKQADSETYSYIQRFGQIER